MAFPRWLRSLQALRANTPARGRHKPRPAAPRRKLSLEILEDRVVPSAYVVTTTADTGPGSLRDAITQVNADTSHALYASPSNSAVDEIDFAITSTSDTGGGFNAANGVATIAPLPALPVFSNAVIIDGYSQAGASPNTLTAGDNAVLKVELNGAQEPLNLTGVNPNPTVAYDGIGLSITGGGSTVRGLAVNGFSVSGIWLHDSGGGDTIAGNFIGTDVSGTVARPNSWGPNFSYAGGLQNNAVVLYGGGGNSTIGGTDPASRNVISGNAFDGLYIDSNAVTVAGNFIGTDATGGASLGNGGDGVFLDNAGNTTIGGTTSGARNIIAANAGAGDTYADIWVSHGGGNVIQGNYVGTDVTGSKVLGDHNDGIRVINTTDTLVGGTAPGAGNLISGHYMGVESGGSVGTVVQGNFIGTDATGTTATGTDGKPMGNINGVSGAAVISGNLISGNRDSGISWATGSVIQGNLIGTDVTGKVALGNHGPYGASGIYLPTGSDNNLIGGTTAGARNVISANDGGLSIGGSGNVIEGNYIGTDITGTQALGNQDGGVGLGGTNNIVGGTTAAARNIISGNQTGFFGGSVTLGGGATGNLVEGNYIGTDLTGEVALGNGTGVFFGAASNNTVSGNVISGTMGRGGVVFDTNGGAPSLTSGNIVQGNLIGTDATGTQILGNASHGVLIVTGQGTQLTGNVIAGAGPVGSDYPGSGVVLDGTSGNTISGNTIFSNAGNGVAIASGTGNSILGNSIHDNAGLGIYLNRANNANDNQVAPGLTSGTSSGAATTVTGTLVGTPTTTFRIEFFANAAFDPHGYGQGQTYLGWAQVTTDQNGRAAFTAADEHSALTGAAGGLDPCPAGQAVLSATATNLTTNDTSAFSSGALTTTAVTSSPAPSVVGQPVTFTATVTTAPAPGGYGYVAFVDTTTGAGLGTVPLSVYGTASLTRPLPTAGPQVITAVYLGWAGVALGSSGSLTQVVNPDPTTVSFGSSSPTSVAGQAITLRANVIASYPGSGDPTGTVSFYDGATLLETDPLVPSGLMYFSRATSSAIATLAVGTHTITATYSGDPNFVGSTSGAFSQTVNAVTTDNLQTVLSSQYLRTGAATVTLQAVDDASAQNAVAAMNGVAAVTDWKGNPVPTAVNLTLNFAKSSQLTFSNGDPNVTLELDGSPLPNGTTVDPAVPAVTVTQGNVIIKQVTFTESGDAPTILVTGGHLTLRNSIVQESTGYSDPAISVTGGTVDLGNASVPGGNTINVNGAGRLLDNSSPNLVTVGGDSFTANGAPVSPLTVTTVSSLAPASLLNQPVTFTATVNASASGGGTPTGTVYFEDLASGAVLGSAPLSGGSATVTTAALPVGARTIVAVYTGDASFINSYGTASQVVTYKFSGFLAPLNSNLAMALNRTVPVKFLLTDYNGAIISNLNAVTSLQVLDSSGSDVLAGAGKTGLRYDATANQFVYNWQTKGLPAGTYTVTLALADGRTYTKAVQLSKTGSSAALLADGNSAVTTATGALLGGDIALYVDNTNGDLTADELARIQDAVTAVDAVTEPYGVAVQEVTDATLADVTLNMDTTSAVGGYADGVLGCTTDAGQITLIAGWNFYTGSDATQVGSSQYDFQTVVTHELGHALGLGHSADSTSVMYATLASGTSNRTLTSADLNVPDTDSTCACGLHAAVARASSGHSLPLGITSFQVQLHAAVARAGSGHRQTTSPALFDSSWPDLVGAPLSNVFWRIDLASPAAVPGRNEELLPPLSPAERSAPLAGRLGGVWADEPLAGSAIADEFFAQMGAEDLSGPPLGTSPVGRWQQL
jgi:parallel beta-helix repeat protein